MINDKALFEFVEPYYVDKDIMHNMWHIELVQRTVNRILSQCSYIVDEECLRLATYFHGFIYRDEARIKQWMLEQNYDEEKVLRNILFDAVICRIQQIKSGRSRTSSCSA